jgi:hypothetical protein
MKQLVHERDIALFDTEGRAYDRAFIWAEPQPLGTWGAWIEFLSQDGARVLRTDRETTQSNLEGVAYWATGLEPVYFEGAFHRALMRHTEPAPAPRLGVSPGAGGGTARLQVETVDPEVPLRLMASRTLVPSLRRFIHNAGVLVYRGMAGKDGDETRPVYEFVAQFGSDNEAAILANTIWSDLHGRGAALSIDDIPVPLDHVLIKEMLLGADAP